MSLCYLTVEYLGHVVPSEGCKPIARKVQAVLEAPAPQNVMQLHSFLGTWYEEISVMHLVGHSLLCSDNMPLQYSLKTCSKIGCIQLLETRTENIGIFIYVHWVL